MCESYEQNDNTKDTNFKKEEISRNLLFHFDTIFHSRINIFIIVQAVFFAALSQTWDKQYLHVPLCTIAIFLTLLVGMANYNLSKKLKFLIKEYKEYDTTGVYKQVMNIKTIWVLPTTTSYALFIPTISLLAWIASLCWYYL